MLSRLALALLLLLGACSAEPPRVVVEITAGQEKDTFSMDPRVTRIDIEALSLDGTIRAQASAVPGGSFDLGEVPADQRFRFEATGVSEDGTLVVRGRSLAGIPVSAPGSTLPLFVQRTNLWARPPGGLPRTHVSAPAGVRGEQYVYLGGGTSLGPDMPVEGDFYDLLTLRGSSAGAFPRVPETIVSLGRNALLLNAEGATALSDLGATELSPPLGLSFAEVAGGRPVSAGDGRAFVVGAIRRDAPTRAVLIVEADGSLGAATLMEARVGAAAVWVEGAGLVVAGGSPNGPGVEVLRDGATAFGPRGYPADPVMGAGAAIDANGKIMLIGGSYDNAAAPTRRIDPSCESGCSVEAVESANLPAPIVGVAAFALKGGRVIAVGEEQADQGMTRSFLVDLGGAVKELALREPRRGASMIPAPNGTLAILGGLHADGSPALSVELLFPE